MKLRKQAGSLKVGKSLYQYSVYSWRLFARGGWFVLISLTLGTFFASLPVYLAQLQTPCAGSVCTYLQLSVEQVEVLKGLGLSPGDYATYTIALTLAIM